LEEIGEKLKKSKAEETSNNQKIAILNEEIKKISEICNKFKGKQGPSIEKVLEQKNKE